jgi:hypothetical protein
MFDSAGDEGAPPIGQVWTEHDQLGEPPAWLSESGTDSELPTAFDVSVDPYGVAEWAVAYPPGPVAAQVIAGD